MGFRDRIANLLIPVSKFISKLHRPETAFSSASYIKIKSKLRDFDILVSRTEWEVSNMILPGKWKHCAIYRNGMVYEATTKGVRSTTVEEFLFKKDKVGLCRARPYIDELEGEMILEFLLKHIGDRYDYAFNWGSSNKALYCSEYVYFGLCAGIRGFEANFKLKNLLGETDCSPADLWAQLSQVETYE